MEKYFKLRSNSELKNILLDFAKNTDTKWIHKNAFDIAIVPTSVLINDNTVCTLMKKFNAVPVIFRMPAWQFYRFHTDAIRSCALNLFLEGADSQTYYGTDTQDEEIMNISELVYEPNCYYLLNTHMKHAVVNRNNTRYMFSLGFNVPLDYTTVREFCQEHLL